MALVVLAAALYHSRDRLEAHVHYWTGTSPFLPRSAACLWQRVDIAPGDIEVRDFLQLLADMTGMPVRIESTAPAPAIARQKILIPAPLSSVDDEIVVEILRHNRFRVDLEELPGGHHRLCVIPQGGCWR